MYIYSSPNKSTKSICWTKMRSEIHKFHTNTHIISNDLRAC